MAKEYFIGLMSGTSLDGIDAVLVNFDEANRKIEQLASRQDSFPDRIKTDLLALIKNPAANDTDLHRQLDQELALLYSESVAALLADTGKDASEVIAIGCHGQTVNHQPDANPPFSVQLGDGLTIAKTTGIRTVNDFRRADLELGGQGAPLAPAFHEWAFARPEGITGVVNIGGIANITILNPEDALLGYDTGPGNTLMDLWTLQEQNRPFDMNGDWARAGQADLTLLEQMLADEYFSRPSPKSTGREYFNMAWLTRQLECRDAEIPAVNVQATLAELTAAPIAAAAKHYACETLWLCGGGAHNAWLRERIAHHLEQVTVSTTAALGIEPDWVEAVAFAWLARARINKMPAGRPSVTGASAAALLGNIYAPVNS